MSRKFDLGLTDEDHLREFESHEEMYKWLDKYEDMFKHPNDYVVDWKNMRIVVWRWYRR